MDNPNQNVVKKIAQDLDCGFDCYYNSKTDEIVAIPSFSQLSVEEDFIGVFRDSLEKVEKHQTDYLKFEVLESFESFKIMERFIERITDKKFKTELENILTNKKPFKNFKHRIDRSDFRQDWFDFKRNELEKMVENQLNNEKASG